MWKTGVRITGVFTLEHQTSCRRLPSDRRPTLLVQHHFQTNWDTREILFPDQPPLPKKKPPKTHTNICYLKIINVIDQNDRHLHKEQQILSFSSHHTPLDQHFIHITVNSHQFVLNAVAFSLCILCQFLTQVKHYFKLRAFLLPEHFSSMKSSDKSLKMNAL